MLPEPPDRAADHDPAVLDAALERQELEEIAQDLLGLLVFTKQDRVLEAAALIPGKVSMARITQGDMAMRRLALTLILDAVLQRPDVLVAALQDLSARLVADAPRLERSARITPAADDARPAR